ncbi:MAG: hypothetical protein AB7K37_01940 [Cyclobacteriaceae bacterium]
MDCKILIAVVLIAELLVGSNLAAQVNALGGDESVAKRKGYIGLIIGFSTPQGDYLNHRRGNASVGSHLNLVRFGYVFTNRVGMAGHWYGGANFYRGSNQLWSYGGMLVGPTLSSYSKERPNPKIEADISPMIGYAVANSPDFGSGAGQSISAAFLFATTLRWNVGEKVVLLVTADWLYSKSYFENYGIYQVIFTSTLGIGVAYRLR